MGRCGLYCAACRIYRAERDSPAWRAEIAAHFKCKPEEVRCRGCGALTPDCWGYNCQFLICQREKGLESCYQCREYHQRTCARYEAFAQRYLEEYGVDVRAGLDMVASGHGGEWLQQMIRRYTCPHCHKPLAVGETECHHCHRPLAAPAPNEPPVQESIPSSAPAETESGEP